MPRTSSGDKFAKRGVLSNARYLGLESGRENLSVRHSRDRRQMPRKCFVHIKVRRRKKILFKSKSLKVKY